MGRRGRGKSQIHYEILRAVKNGTHLQSRIAQTARLCHSDLKHNLKALVDAGLLRLGELSSYGAEKIFLTCKGAEFVKQAVLTDGNGLMPSKHSPPEMGLLRGRGSPTGKSNIVKT